MIILETQTAMNVHIWSESYGSGLHANNNFSLLYAGSNSYRLVVIVSMEGIKNFTYRQNFNKSRGA